VRCCARLVPSRSLADKLYQPHPQQPHWTQHSILSTQSPRSNSLPDNSSSAEPTCARASTSRNPSSPRPPSPLHPLHPLHNNKEARLLPRPRQSRHRMLRPCPPLRFRNGAGFPTSLLRRRYRFRFPLPPLLLRLQCARNLGLRGRKRRLWCKRRRFGAWIRDGGG
jgi:hypothetical protein